MKNKLRFLSELVLMFTFVSLCGMHSLFAATVTDEMKDSQDSENISMDSAETTAQNAVSESTPIDNTAIKPSTVPSFAESVGEPSVVEKAAAIPAALPEAANKETPKSKKSWVGFLKDKLDTSKKTASEGKEDSKNKKGLMEFFSGKQEPSNQGGGGGGGGSAIGSATSAPVGGSALRASNFQNTPVNAVQVPRPEVNSAAGGAAISPIIRVERPVTVNTNAPAGPPRPERPSADIRPNEDRGIGR